MGAIPSPTSTTVPTSADSACPSKPRIFALMISLISELIPLPLARHLLAQGVEPRARRRAPGVAPHRPGGPPGGRRVHGEGRLDGPAGRALEPADDALALAVAHGH